MQLKKLAYRRAFGGSGEIEFGAVSPELSAARGADAETAERLLYTAIYGAEDKDFAGLCPDAEIELIFAYDGAEYRLARMYREGEAVSLLTEREGGPVALPPETREETLRRAFGARPAAWNPEFCGARGVLEAHGAKPELLERLKAETARETRDREDEIRALETAIGAVPKKETDASLPSVAEIEAERAAIRASLARAEEKTRLAFEARTAEEELAAFAGREADIKQLETILKNDDALREAGALKKRCLDARRKIESLEAERTDAVQMRGAAAKKNAGGAEAEKECEADFLYKTERVNALRKRFMTEICGAIDENSAVRRSLQAAYERNDPAIRELQAKKKRLDGEYEALLLSITSLEDKKTGLVRPMSYKKAVIDGTVLENRIEKLTGTIEDLNRRSGELQLEIGAKSEDIRDAEAEIRRLDAEMEEARNALLAGKYRSVAEALNADCAAKNEIYANFVVAENLRAELRALDKKIFNVARQNDGHKEKEKELDRAKTELEIGLLKLSHKKSALEAELRQKAAERIFSEEAEKLRYGARCPVCDGFVVKKNEPARPADGVSKEELKAVETEISAVKEKLDKIHLKLGAYFSTTASGEAYLVSLKSTSEKKRALLNEIYRKYGASDADGFRLAIDRFGETSRALNAAADRLKTADAEFAAVKVKKEVLLTAVQTLSGRESKRIRLAVESARRELNETLSEYQKLMPVFGGKPAKELLSGSLVDDIELETVDGDLVSQTKNFREVTVQKIETDRLLMLLKNRLVSDLKDAESETATDVVLREFTRVAKELSRELETSEAEQEDAKLKLAAVRRVNRNARKTIGDGEEREDRSSEEIARLAEEAENAENAAREILKSAGVGAEGFESLILGAADRFKAEKALREYTEKRKRLEYRAEYTATRPTTLEWIDVEGLGAREAELSELEKTVMRAESERELSEQWCGTLAKRKRAAEAARTAAEHRAETLGIWLGSVRDGAVDFDALEAEAEAEAARIYREAGGKSAFPFSRDAEPNGKASAAGGSDSALAAVAYRAAVKRFLSAVDPEAVAAPIFASFPDSGKKEDVKRFAEAAKAAGMLIAVVGETNACFKKSPEAFGFSD